MPKQTMPKQTMQNSTVVKMLVCLLGVAADFRMIPKVTGLLPLASVGLYWILPALLGGVIGACIPMRHGN